MATIFPVDDVIDEPWYPGYDPARNDDFMAFDRPGNFSKKDETAFWPLDFHYPRGVVPLGVTVIVSGACWGSQVAAEAVPLPAGRGLRGRFVGPHLYATEVPVASPFEIELRTGRVAQRMPELIAGFPEMWRRAVAELEGWQALERRDLSTLDRAGIGAFFDEAVTYVRRAWEIHFEAMYPLLANYLGFQGLCGELGLDPGQVATFLQGYPSKIVETDRELWRLTALAREQGLEALFASTEAADLSGALRSSPAAEAWLREFDSYIDVYGWRTEVITDVAVAPWVEDPISPLGTIKTFLTASGDHDFDAAIQQAAAEREHAIAGARSQLTGEELKAFDAALESCRAANFTWWNEEHNFYIDLRAHIPIRRAALALADALGVEERDDVFFLFSYEFRDLCAGRQEWSDLADITAERRAWFIAWQERRGALPRVLGTRPQGSADPVVKEIFGMGRHYFEALEADGGAGTRLEGLPASSGVARGRARVLLSPAELHAIEPGEVLVCEATSPSWTPAFTKIAACVCDVGGSLTHASIVSREYRIPCVTACAVATTTIRTGDIVEVDGGNGVVTIVSRGEAEPAA
ncbi:PEP-utilizing enzyme [Gaiella occulta]|uniref:PEP-utilizing enzyme n=1 Tax=Gaiella occulta TaxID=1002870 RepID=A0A7M2YY33_9ACTN|nr:PEP-utilizing enzyme [Gaiella occulta]RDI74388.1 PEP-utilizing enzyme [Gaiella occulta]